MSAARAVILRLLLVAISLGIFLATGEIALRIIYRDGGTRTLGGPGGGRFEHLTIDGKSQRGRMDIGPKTLGKPRIVVLGDSITWGQGVRDWQDTWPEIATRALEAAGTPHDMAVLAMPGRNIPAHVAGLESWARELQPDVLIYQWYVNDIEIDEHRPDTTRWWQTQWWHDPLQEWSYLYFFLESRLATFLPPPGRSYVDYILEDYAPGTLEWSEFERYFHRLAAQAREIVPTRILVIYPQVPFRGTSPLEPLQRRLAALASSATQLDIPPAAWIRKAGVRVARADAKWKQALKVEAGTAGPVIDTRDYYLPAAGTDVTLTLSFDNAPTGPVGRLDVIDIASEDTRASFDVVPSAATGWQSIELHVPSLDNAPLVRFRLSSLGKDAFAISNIALSIGYGFDVVDLTNDLNTFNTHTSVFDAHPNEAAHRVMADRIVKALQEAEAEARH